MSPVPAFFAGYQTRVDEVLRQIVVSERGAIERSMAYTLFAPSKRVRPVLTLLSAELCGGQSTHALAAAVAVELVHTSSLILDDLPAMDNAALRRGRAANHLEFGEATAILAAFGLLNLAYGTLARRYDPSLSTRLATLLDDAVGNDGLIAGQAADLLATEQEISFELLERIHRGKTGALFSASAVAGALTAALRRRLDRGALRVCQEPRPRVSDHRRPAGRGGRSIADREGHPERRTQDDVRVVQRRCGRAPACRGALFDSRPRAGAVRPARRSSARAVRVCRSA